MFRKGFFVAAILVLPAMAMAQARGPWELTLSGNAAHAPTPRGVDAAVTGSIGYFIGDALELSLRETATYNDIVRGGGIDSDTRVAVDLHFPLGDEGQIVPFVGANIGYIAGPDVRNQFEAAPEAGVKLFVNNSTFIFVSVEYQFFFNQNSQANTAFSNGEFIYGLGVGFRF